MKALLLTLDKADDIKTLHKIIYSKDDTIERFEKTFFAAEKPSQKSFDDYTIGKEIIVKKTKPTKKHKTELSRIQMVEPKFIHIGMEQVSYSDSEGPRRRIFRSITPDLEPLERASWDSYVSYESIIR